MEIQRELTLRYKSIGLKNSASLRKLIDKFDDGDVTERQVESIFDHVEKLQKKSAKTIDDRKRRFEALKREHKAATKSEQAA